MLPLSDVFFRWSSGCLRCITVLVYAAPMKKPIIQRLLSFLLACVLLGQVQAAMADWHIDVVHTGHDIHTPHLVSGGKHLVTWDGHGHSGQSSDIENHQHCCHTTTASIALPVVSVALPSSKATNITSTFTLDHYRDPLADLLIRPPIA